MNRLTLQNEMEIALQIGSRFFWETLGTDQVIESSEAARAIYNYHHRSQLDLEILLNEPCPVRFSNRVRALMRLQAAHEKGYIEVER